MTVHSDVHGAAFAPVSPVNTRGGGLRAHLAGLSAEGQVAGAYAARGADLIELRWRGQGGEIDLILRDGAELVFAEVKSSATIERAIANLRPAQMRRIHLAASEYLGGTPDGQLTQVRFDLAAVDAAGHIEIIENAFGHF